MTIPPIPDFVRTQVRQFTAGNMLATIQILRGNLGTLDTTSGLVGGMQNAQAIYAGKARIHTVSGAGVSSVGGGEIDTRQTVISIPMSSVQIHRDDLVRVVADDAADTDLDTRIFRVLDVDGGSFFGDARRMSCVGWYESRYWGSQ